MVEGIVHLPAQLQRLLLTKEGNGFEEAENKLDNISSLNQQFVEAPRNFKSLFGQPKEHLRQGEDKPDKKKNPKETLLDLEYNIDDIFI